MTYPADIKSLVESQAGNIKAAQHRVHPTGGSRLVFKQFAWLGVGSGKAALSRPAHPRVTHTVSQRVFLEVGPFVE